MVTSFSLRSCFVKSKVIVANDENLFVKFWLPSERWLSLQGKVGYSLARVGFSLIFTDLTENDKTELSSLAERTKNPIDP